MIQRLDDFANGFRVPGWGLLIGNSEEIAERHYLFDNAHLLQKFNVLGWILFVELGRHNDSGLPPSLD